jgi:hypothetical protein
LWPVLLAMSSPANHPPVITYLGVSTVSSAATLTPLRIISNPSSDTVSAARTATRARGRRAREFAKFAEPTSGEALTENVCIILNLDMSRFTFDEMRRGDVLDDYVLDDYIARSYPRARISSILHPPSSISSGSLGR